MNIVKCGTRESVQTLVRDSHMEPITRKSQAANSVAVQLMFGDDHLLRRVDDRKVTRKRIGDQEPRLVECQDLLRFVRERDWR